MNYLAHLYLADDSPHGLVGALLPDMARGGRNGQFHPLIRSAITLHHRIDSFTDTHPVFARSRRRIDDDHRLFSGIIVDMLYDHLLAADWSSYSGVPVDGFIDYVHDVLSKHTYLMPEQMRPRIGRMVEQGWLRSYATIDGITARLAQMSAGMSSRLGRTVRMQDAVAGLDGAWADLSEDFGRFFPELVEHVRADAQPPAVAQRWAVQPT